MVESWLKDYKTSRKIIILWNGHGRLRSARQQKVWKALQKSSQFVEVPLSFDEIRDNIIAANKIAASVRISGICAEVHNGADEATLTAIFRALKSC